LTNNSVTKGVSDIIGDGIEENMLSNAEFRELLKQRENGEDVFQTVLKPQMEKCAV
jgi:hypothetical protein